MTAKAEVGSALCQHTAILGAILDPIGCNLKETQGTRSDLIRIACAGQRSVMGEA